MNILIVDDDSTNRRLLRATLEAEGHRVLDAADGVEALGVLERERVEGVVSDILMSGMDGYRLCSEVRRNPRFNLLPFVFYTSTFDSPGDEQLGLQMGAQAFIRKPAATDVILNALRSATSSRVAARPPLATLDETDVLKEYSERLVAKLEEKNIALAEQTAALLKVEQQLRFQATTLETAANAILIADRTGAIQWVNPAFTSLTGYTAEEVIGKTPRVLKSGKHDAAFYRNLWGTILSGQTWRGEFTNRRKDGSLFYDEHTITPVRSEGGAITHFIGILHDVTARKRAEEAIAQRARLAALSADVSLSLTRASSLPEMLQRCAAALVTYLNAAFARIWTLNDAEKMLELKASAGMYTHLNGPHGRAPVGKFKIGLIAQERKPHLTNAVVGDPRVSDQEWAKREGMVAFAGYPLLLEGRVVGVMALFAKRPLTEETLTALGSVADAIALGIERKQAEESLRDSEGKFRQLTENINEVFWITDPLKNQMLYISPAYEKIWGRTCESLYQAPHNWLEAIHPDDRERVQQAAMTRQARGEYDETYRITRPDGAMRWIRDRAFPIRNAEGKVYRVVGTAEDITGQKEAEQRLSAHHDLTQVLSEAATLAQAAGKILQIVCRSFQWDVGELWIVDPSARRLRCLEVWHPPSTEFNEFVAVSRTTTFAAGEGVPGRVWESGRTAWIADVSQDDNLGRKPLAVRIGLRSAIAFPIRLRNETFGVIDFFSAQIRPPDEELLAMFTTIGSQIGEFIGRKRLEEQFRQSQKMEAFGQLAGGVAHDFNNILAVIMGYTSLVMENDGLNAGLKEEMKQVYAAGERAANLARQLLTFSRKKEMEVNALDLNGVIGNLAKMLGRVIGENIKLQCNYASSLPSVQADEGMMEQVLMNLAVNARDAMPNGGQLIIDTSRTITDAAYTQRNPEAGAGEFVCVSVRDTGCGMTPEIKARIFEPFFTTKGVGKGTGLGLATVYGIVKQHRGWLEVESQVGAGTTFKVFLPASVRMASAPGQAAGEARARGGDETILLVEDEPALRTLGRAVLQRHGYRVLEASSGVEALEVWERNSGRVDLLLTDMVMPEGVTGRELAKQLQARKPELKVIYTSGYSLDSTATSFRLREAKAFLQKPYHPQKLIKMVRETLDAGNS